MLILAQVATFLLIFAFGILLSEVLIKIIIEKSGYQSEQILKHTIFSKIFFTNKLLLIIALFGTLILWMLYLVSI